MVHFREINPDERKFFSPPANRISHLHATIKRYDPGMKHAFDFAAAERLLNKKKDGG